MWKKKDQKSFFPTLILVDENLDAMGGEKVCLFLILFLSKNLWIFWYDCHLLTFEKSFQFSQKSKCFDHLEPAVEFVCFF